jgi:hypothetical protein
MLGATFTDEQTRNRFSVVRDARELRSKHGHSQRLAQIPRYSPATPSFLTITTRACRAPLYCGPSAVPIPRTCIFRRNTSKGYVSVCEIAPIRSRVDSWDQVTVYETLTLGKRLTGEGAAGQFADDSVLIRGRDCTPQGFVGCKVDAHVGGNTHCCGYHATIEGQDTAFFPHDFERHSPHGEVFGGPSGMFSCVD